MENHVPLGYSKLLASIVFDFSPFFFFFGYSQWDAIMNLALKQFQMPVVFAKVTIQLARFIKACTSTSTKRMVSDAANSVPSLVGHTLCC